ncbi:MAG: hypothetical protein KDD69_15945 [Bdellovibrionales bacterium]|nr:hypothetical protein [Bdellovibrionales bacterium]
MLHDALQLYASPGRSHEAITAFATLLIGACRQADALLDAVGSKQLETSEEFGTWIVCEPIVVGECTNARWLWLMSSRLALAICEDTVQRAQAYYAYRQVIDWLRGQNELELIERQLVLQLLIGALGKCVPTVDTVLV